MDTLIKHAIIRIFSTPLEVFQAAVEEFARRAHEAVAKKGLFTVVLSGGNTARFFFDALTEAELHIPWNQIKFFFGDERYVPSDDIESNYHTAKEHLFSRVSVPLDNIYPMSTESGDSKAAADSYEATLRKVFALKNNEMPKFDLIYLGLGEDGHTASLMPFSDALINPSENRLVVSLWVPKLKMYRMTLTPCAMNNSTCICFLVTGANKASAITETLEGPFNPQQYPAQLIQCADEKNMWYLDQAAAGKLRK